MTPFEKFTSAVAANLNFDTWAAAKVAVLVFLFLYVLFSLVVVKQVKLMSKTVKGMMENGIRVVAYALVGVAIAAFVLAMIIL